MSLKCKRNQAEFEDKQQQIESLKELEDNGYIDLYFGDENHFGLTRNAPYAWQTKENPILLPAAKGKFLNVAGLMNLNELNGSWISPNTPVIVLKGWVSTPGNQNQLFLFLSEMT